jgi:hypothetical protein
MDSVAPRALDSVSAAPPERRRLSAGQERLWFLQQLNGATGLYNEHASIRFSGRLSIPALHQSVAAVARIHESLQWTVRDDGDAPVAIAGEEPRRGWVDTIDLEGLPTAEERERAYRQCATEAARRPFQLSAGPLWRVLLFRFSPCEFALAVVMHHIISDSWSMQILVEDLCRAYRAITGGTPPSCGRVDYDSVSAPAAADEDALRYWKDMLADAPTPVSLPAHRPRSSVRRFAGAKQYFTLDEQTTASLRAYVRAEHATPFIVLLALWKAYLGMSTGARELVVGTTTAGRQKKEMERLIGFFANTVAIRTAFRSSDSFRQFVSHVRAVALQALEHQTVPFDQVVRALNLSRSPNRQPLFEVMFIYVNTPVLELALPGVSARLTPEDIALGLSKFDLVISFCETPQAVQGLIDYSVESYNAGEIRAHLDRFRTFAARALADPDSAIRDLVPIEGPPAAAIADLQSAWFTRRA